MVRFWAILDYGAGSTIQMLRILYVLLIVEWLSSGEGGSQNLNVGIRAVMVESAPFD